MRTGDVRLSRYQLSMLADMIVERLRKKPLPSTKKYTAEEAAEYLHVTIGTLYNIAKGIPHTKMGKRLIFTEENLYNYFNR